MARFASKQQRDLIWILQDGKCAICGHDLGNSFEVDHLIPHSEKGVTELCNLQALCHGCHSEKTSGMVRSAFSRP